MQYIEDLIDELNLEELCEDRNLETIKKKINLNARQFARLLVAVFAVLLFLVILKYGNQISVFIFGVLYPGYKTIKARNELLGGDECNLLLIYWVVYALYITLVQPIVKVVFSGVPLYFVGEVALVIWLYHSKSKGANLINQKVFQPLLKKYGKFIDQHLKEIKEKVKAKED